MDASVSEREPAGTAEAPLFMLSFRQRDELAAAAAMAGWRVAAARRGEGVARRFLASGAAVAVIDARGSLSEALEAAQALGEPVAATGAAMLVLVAQSDAVRIGEFFAAGATHFLSSPMSTAAIAQALRFAHRHVERLAVWQGRAIGPVEPLGWRWDGALRSLQVTPALAALLELDERAGPFALMRRLAPDDRRLAAAALRRLRPEAPATAFAHELGRSGRVVQHLQLDARTGRLHALVEPLGTPPDASAAVRDALTGVRDAASARLWLDRRLADGANVGAILVALTRIESINIAHGRTAGDLLLRDASRRIEEAVRGSLGRGAMVARIGGSEFLVASDSASELALAEAAQAVEAALARPLAELHGPATVGVRLARVQSEPGEDAAALLSRAADALADRRGARGGETPLDRLAMGVQHAIDAGQIGIRFQPQVAIATRAIAGAEALARWQHPELGEVGAEMLFAAAERADLSLALSAHVQRRALEEAARWPAALARVRLSINVTAQDVARPNFVDTLLGTIDASGFPRARLTVEITESGVMEDLGEAARLLSQLRTAGCRVAIDDFGTGYSSLAYLKALPLDYLKIDRRLSQDIVGTARDRIVVRGVIDMARSLGLSVVAEGVETQAQLELLAKEGCNYYQGFLCAPPLDPVALARLVEAPR